MRQLTGLDVQFLNIESSTTVGHVAGLSILDPSTAPMGSVTGDRLRELMAQRLHLAKPLRWRLVEVPLGLDNPYWIEDPEFDLEYHVREIALPAPGDDRQLGEQVARLHARPLDRRRPLWEFYLIHGLAGGRQALYGKVHHAVIDGVSGAEILGVLMDLTPEPRETPQDSDWQPEQPPSQLALLRAGVLHMAALPVRTLMAVPRTLPHLEELPGASRVPGTGLVSTVTARVSRLARLAPAQVPVPERPSLDVPPTPFNGAITPHRRFAFGSLPLADVKAVKNAFGVTVNDVVMALCTSALRRWLLDHDALPDMPLIVAVPVSVRTEEQQGVAGNQISMMMAPLPTHVPDPVARLEEIHEAMEVAKERFKALPATWLQELSEMLPAALSGLAARAVFKLVTATKTPPFNLFISNVPGPQIPLYSVGARMVGHYPVSAISDISGGLNITVISYDGHLDFGVIACREMVPDVWNIMDYLREALDELTTLATTPPRG